MPQNAAATATTATQAFPAGTQLGGQYRFRATGTNPVVAAVTRLETNPVTTFTGLAAGVYTFDACRMGVDTTTVMGPLATAVGVVLSTDVNVTVVASLSVSVVQV